MQSYCDFFQTLHDETTPTGYLGRGTHYSVLRAIVFHDAMGKPLPEGKYANFAVIWDEDHDVRVMEPIQEIYRRGLLPSFVIFGERKGLFTAILSNELSALTEAPPFNPAFLRKAEELELSIRSANCLRNDGIMYVGELIHKTEAELLQTPNYGRKSVHEIGEALRQIGLHIGMDVPGWTPENVERVLKNKERIGFLETEIDTICHSLADSWTSKAVVLTSAENSIIDDENKKVSLYLETLHMLWRLGIARKQDRSRASGLLGLEPIKRRLSLKADPVR